MALWPLLHTVQFNDSIQARVTGGAAFPIWVNVLAAAFHRLLPLPALQYVDLWLFGISIPTWARGHEPAVL